MNDVLMRLTRQRLPAFFILNFQFSIINSLTVLRLKAQRSKAQRV